MAQAFSASAPQHATGVPSSAARQENDALWMVNEALVEL